ncbi:MAG: amidase [Granulosicoccus sp.]
MAYQTLTALARAFDTGEFNSCEHLQALLARVDAVNAEAHVFIRTLPDMANTAADAADRRRLAGQALGPLDGVPVAIKDNLKLAHCPTSAGTEYNFSQSVDEESSVVERLKAAGAVIIGKANMDEGAIGATTNNPFWGQCDNPCIPGMTPGGSSGGSAAAVATGWVPMALGSDTLGSVRIPAAYCGIWGLKPTKGLLSEHGMVGLSSTLDSIGPLANCAEDIASTLEILVSKVKQGSGSASVSVDWDATSHDYKTLEGVRLGVLDWQSEVNCEDVVQRSFDAMIDAATAAGAQLVKIDIKGWKATQARRTAFLIAEAECASWLLPIIEQHEQAFSDDFKAMMRYGHSVSASKLDSAYQYVAQMKHSIERSLDAVNFMVMPTVPQGPFPHTSDAPANQADFTALANIAGCPAVAFPVKADGVSIPVSAQVMGKAFEESNVLGIARLLSNFSVLARR